MNYKKQDNNNFIYTNLQYVHKFIHLKNRYIYIIIFITDLYFLLHWQVVFLSLSCIFLLIQKHHFYLEKIIKMHLHIMKFI